MDSVLDAVLKGVGLGYVFESQIKGISGQSRIVRVLEDWCPPDHRYFLYYPSRRNFSFTMRTFLAFLRERSR
jgi:DNA-binding transcriptional LysR family regulator